MSDAHEDDHAGGHGDDPNAGVVLGTPPTPAWVLTSVVIGLVTLAATVVLAIALGAAPDAPAETDHTPGNTTMEHTE